MSERPLGVARAGKRNSTPRFISNPREKTRCMAGVLSTGALLRSFVCIEHLEDRFAATVRDVLILCAQGNR
jgi:hypothetical protein